MHVSSWYIPARHMHALMQGWVAYSLLVKQYLEGIHNFEEFPRSVNAPKLSPVSAMNPHNTLALQVMT